ncbi:MAG: ribosome biogenesis GTPase Der, partial [Acidobacteriota bacterium]
IDHPGRHGDAMEFHRLGCPRLYEITAEHGQGVAELLDEMVRELPESEQEVERAETRVAIVGRPNVGKSSLLNRLVGRSRCVVHEMAGTTRDAVDTIVEKGRQTYRFVDTAGIRRKGKTPSRADRLGVLYAERAIERAHLCLLVLDGTEGIMREDAAIAAKVARAGRGAVLVFNKWDLVKDRERRARILGCETPERLPHLDFAPLVFVSALSGRSVSKLLPLVDLIREQQLRRIPTPELNRFLAAATSHYAPRGRHGKEVKFFFMTQIGVAPPRFVVFANEDKELQRDYSRYLVRRLREGFGFEGTPVRIVMRKRKQRP